MTALARTLENIRTIDRLSIRWVAAQRRPVMDLLMRGFTRAGDWQTWTFLSLAALACGETSRAIALQVLPKLLLTLVTARAIKKLSKRPRPAKTLHGFASLLQDPDPYSFPSAHAACAWAVAIGLGLAIGGWPVWIAYAMAISYSRIYVGAHYPLDVLLGGALGAAIAFAI
jgi:undecaprenyl-diphosphatase